MINEVSNIWMPVEDTGRAIDFYQNTLGFEMVLRDGAWAEFEADGLRIGLNGRKPGGTQVEGWSSPDVPAGGWARGGH